MADRELRIGEEGVRNVRVRLTPFEQAVAKELGKARQRANDDAGLRDRKATERNSEEMHIDAAGAEIAVCRLLNVYPDLDVQTGNGERAVHDARWITGTLDIKYTYHGNGGIAAPSWKKNKACNFYILVTGKMPDFTVVGWTWGDLIFEDEYFKPEWSVPGYLFPQDKLNPFLPGMIVNKSPQ